MQMLGNKENTSYIAPTSSINEIYSSNAQQTVHQPQNKTQPSKSKDVPFVDLDDENPF